MSDTLSRGTNYDDNPVQVMDRGTTVKINRNPALVKANIEHVWSSRRDLNDPKMSSSNWTTGTLSKEFKNVTRIDLIGARIPIDVSMQDKKSVYLSIKAGNLSLQNIQFSRPFGDSRAKSEAKDLFDLNGAFAHFFIKSDPIIWEDVNPLPTISYSFHTPVNINKLEIKVLVEPTDPTTAPSEPLYVAVDEDVRLIFRILSQN